ncbi:16786_t:CDS:2 [Funneliformis mosseae]|uniref:16786_t:CDS:1 n=1 Tax=Funneliformis mosseae TaxID=27381 RepID=A0A9N9CWH1_FUNMO|nr:16786_t:CDS:2 [Funneliformis mosseae]
MIEELFLYGNSCTPAFALGLVDSGFTTIVLLSEELLFFDSGFTTIVLPWEELLFRTSCITAFALGVVDSGFTTIVLPPSVTSKVGPRKGIVGSDLRAIKLPYLVP